MKTFLELKSDVSKLSQRSGDTDFLSEIGDWINVAQTFLFNSYDYFTELQGKYNFTTVASQEDYALPNDFDKPMRIYDIDNNNKLTIKTEEEYFDGNIANIIDVTTGATPKFARIYGARGTQVALAAAGTTLQVKSSSASDTGSIVVRVEGYVDSSKTILSFEDITISVASPTTFVAGTTTFYEITRVSKSANTTGYITVANSSDTTLATMTSIDRVLSHKILKLGLIPNTTVNMRVLYKRKIRTLVNDNDYPFIDADQFLVLEALGYTLLYERSESSEARAAQVFAKAKESLFNILSNLNNNLGPDFQQKIETSFMAAHRS